MKGAHLLALALSAVVAGMLALPGRIADASPIIQVSQPVQVTSDSHYERGQSIVHDGTNYWLFYGRSDTVTGNYDNANPDITDYKVYFKKASSVPSLTSAASALISGVAHNANSYLGETGAAYFGGEVWAFATIDVGATADLYGWYTSDGGTSWTEVGPIISGLSDGQAHHDEVAFGGELWVVEGSGNFTTTHSSTPKSGGWSTPLVVDSSPAVTGGLAHFFVEGSDLYLAAYSNGRNYIYKYNPGTVAWDKVDEITPPEKYDPTLFKLGSTYVFAQAPWVSDGSPGGRQYIVAWSSGVLNGTFFDGAHRSVTEGKYGTNSWVDMWPIGFTDAVGDTYLLYTSERDQPTAEGTGNIWYLKWDWDPTSDHYTYIQEAIDGATSTTINVAAGTYAENVTVDKSLTLAGAGQGSTIVIPAVSNANPCAGSSLCGSGTAASNVILLEASDITVHDLTVDGDNPGLTSGIVRDGADLDARNGIVENYYLGVFDNLEVHHVTVKNIYLRGIYPSSGGDNFDIHHNTVQNVQGEDESIAIMGWAGTGVISYNIVSDATGGIVSNWSRGTQYLNNTVTNSEASLHTDNNGGYGGDPDLLQGNVVSDCQPDGYGVFVFAPFLPATVRENTVTNCAVGLSVERSNGGAAVAPLFQDNEVDGQGLADSVGVYVGTVGFGWGSEDVAAELTGNIVENTADGFVIEAEDGYTATVSAVGNSIQGNANSGATTTGPGTLDVDMTGNWWGDVSGPYHATHNPDGTGNSVGDDVAFSPWLGIGSDASGDPGFQMASPMTWVAGPAVCLAGSCIQKAVDFATSGDTIRVREGTFSEHVVVDGKNDLTIEDYGSPKPNVTVPPEATAPIIHVKNASNVIVEGLEIDGAGNGKTGCPSAGDPDTDQRFYGIRYSNSTGTVQNNEVHAIKHPTGSQGCQSGLGIYAYQSSVQIIGNDVYDYQKNGITANLPGTSNIEGNTVTGSGPVGTGYAAQNGIQAGWDATATIDGNTVSDNSYTGSGWAATDILVQAADADVTGNTLTDGYVSLYYIEGSGMIAGNTISATTAGVGRTDYWGIAVSDPPGLSPSPFEDAPAPGGALPLSPGPGVMTVVVNGNTITGDGSADSVGLEVDSGFYGDEDIDLEAAYNEISDWGYGVVTYACSGSCTSGVFLSVEVGPLNSIADNDVGVGVYNDSSAVTVNFNSIVGNATNGVESDDAAHILDAENNWWGACDGPSGVGPGSGDAVSDYVDYDPWIHGACDYDHDLLTDDAERQVHGTEWQNPDTDGDGCADGEELLFTDPALGGLRDPLNPYDFYDITDISGVVGSKDKGVSGFDLNLLLSWGGAVNNGAPNANGKDYDADSNGNTIEDGEEMDFAGLAGPATGPDGGISGFDLNDLLSQGGHSCVAPPP